jgi:hypothetical protein
MPAEYEPTADQRALRVKTLVELMKSRDDRVRLDAAKYYTARRMGWKKQPLSATTSIVSTSRIWRAGSRSIAASASSANGRLPTFAELIETSIPILAAKRPRMRLVAGNDMAWQGKIRHLHSAYLIVSRSGSLKQNSLPECQSTIGRAASARCSRSCAAFVKYNGHSGLTGGATNFRQRTVLPVTNRLERTTKQEVQRRSRLPMESLYFLRTEV